MRLRNATAELYVPDGRPEGEALRRTTHMGVAAHQDDLEIMAYHGILACYARSDRWFLGVTVTDGAGSARDGLYAKFTDEEMRAIRRQEQKKAAAIGEYAAIVLLDYTSGSVKDPARREAIEDLKELFLAARPEAVYTHNPADKHDTHVAVALRTIQALRELPAEVRPARLYGCEVWRDLDWLVDEDKVALRVDAHENLAAALLGVFDSQICGGKRYDLATLGRRRAHATYHSSHGVDDTAGLTFAMDLTPLVADPGLSVGAYVAAFQERFLREVAARLERLGRE
ncbi:MAG: PIG-L deacetylase family protein [Bacteroidota bacterium]